MHGNLSRLPFSILFIANIITCYFPGFTFMVKTVWHTLELNLVENYITNVCNNHSNKVHLVITSLKIIRIHILHSFSLILRLSSLNSYLKVFHVKMYVPSGETSLKLVFASSVKSLCGYKGAIKRRNKNFIIPMVFTA